MCVWVYVRVCACVCVCVCFCTCVCACLCVHVYVLGFLGWCSIVVDFLVACTRLYNPLCRLISQSVGNNLWWFSFLWLSGNTAPAQSGVQTVQPCIRPCYIIILYYHFCLCLSICLCLSKSVIRVSISVCLSLSFCLSLSVCPSVPLSLCLSLSLHLWQLEQHSPLNHLWYTWKRALWALTEYLWHTL